jgi:hypothetical protein
MNIASIGIDLGKTSFHLVALGELNQILFRIMSAAVTTYSSSRRSIL